MASEKLVSYASGIHLALISLDQKNGLEIGRALYRANQDCRICYYSEEPCKLYPLLGSRPIEFFRWQEGQERFIEKIDRMVMEILHSDGIFRHETKGNVYCFWLRSILYLYSDLKYTCVRLLDGSEKSFYAKLSEAERGLQHGFIRIHKRYIVNRMHIREIDKKEHCVYLANGETLPISEAYYNLVLQQMHEP